MRFKRIYIEITNTCNLHCHFCAQNTRIPQFMKRQEFTHILEEIKPYGNYIYLHVLGEPLLHPELDAFLSIASQKGFQINITTNGTRLKQNADILKKYAIRQINVSLHSFPQHQQKDYLADVFSTCEALARKGIYCNYRLWSLRNAQMDEDSKKTLYAITKRYALRLDETRIKRMQRFPLQDHISLHFEEVFTWPSLTHPYINDVGHCHGMKDMCAILVNGDVVPCCLDSHGDCVLGNIHASSFHEIVTSDKAKHMVEEFRKHHISEELCKHCSYRLRFYSE